MLDTAKQMHWPIRAMQWQPLSDVTDSIRYGKVLRIYHSDYVDEDFNPEGIIEGVCIQTSDSEDNEKDLWLGAVWDNDGDCWNTEEVVAPTHVIVLVKPNV